LTAKATAVVTAIAKNKFLSFKMHLR